MPNQLLDNPRFDPETTKFLQDMRVFISGYWGDRCTERQPGCAVCRMWLLYDLFEIMHDEE